MKTNKYFPDGRTVKSTPHSHLAASFCLLAGIAICLALPNDLAAATYYLDAINGSDSNSGTSSILAWKTMEKAKSVATYGDTVLLRNGSYGDFTDSRTTTGTDWIIYKADVGHTPVFGRVTIGQSSGSSYDAYIELDGLTITDSLYMYRRHYINVKNCDIQAKDFDSFVVYGVWASGTTNEHVLIENCEIHHGYRGINPGGDY